MPDKKKEQEKTDLPVQAGKKVEEKRVKPTVIRRRAAEPSEAEKKETAKEAGEFKESAKKPEVKAEAEFKKTAKVEKVVETISSEKHVREPAPTKTKKKGEMHVSVIAGKEASAAKPIKAEQIPSQEAQTASFIPEGAVPREISKEKHVKTEIKIVSTERPVKKKQYEKRGTFGKRGKFERLEKFNKIKPPPRERELKKTEITTPKAAKRVIKVTDAISVGDISQRLGIKAGDIIKKLMDLGIMVTINQFIDADAAALVAHDFGYEVESIAPQEELLLEDISEVDGELKTRPPVVTVMGHVDHGKTSLLDAIRKTNVAAGEAGGITQHIGAYHVHLDKGDITFLDTPGHEAFTAMRARGAKVTDIVVLVVAADDGVMPQTIEAVNHAKAANVPIIVAINKIDIPGAEPNKIRQALTEYGLVAEAWGGDTIFAEVSAKKGIGIKELLELILLQADVLELKANPKKPGKGAIVEAKLDKGRGPVATVLIHEGTVRTGDAFVSGAHSGRVRAMINDWGKKVEYAGPSMPVEVLGLSGVPEAGDVFAVVRDEVTAKQIAGIRFKKKQEAELKKTAKISLAELYEKIKQGEVKELGVVVKGDVQGSVEAVKEVINKLPTDAIKVNIIHSAVGGITEGDVMLGAASNAIVVGFNVRPEPKAQSLAEKEGVDLRLYSIIYELIDDIKKAMEGMLAPTIKENIMGRAEVREAFRVSKVGTVAGCYVVAGKIPRGSRVRLIRDNVVIYDGKMASLKRFKDDVKEVASGYECGIAIEGFNDIKVGDIIESYQMEEVAAKL
ncbi:MAG: translation initiation factor IF-2 [Deltaproteobacteria bacterium]|nr:translation initiation factor IF-2 [Deltaproteobacteria bacterium]